MHSKRGVTLSWNFHSIHVQLDRTFGHMAEVIHSNVRNLIYHWGMYHVFHVQTVDVKAYSILESGVANADFVIHEFWIIYLVLTKYFVKQI